MNTRKNISLLLFAVGVFTFTPALAQSAKEKRHIDIQVPEHVPIKVNLKKDKQEEFQDLSNERWMRSVELEVTNTGNRPIYAVYLMWYLPDVKMPDGSLYGGTFLYGRHEFISVFGERPKPEDDPLEPGETHVFKLPENIAEAWEKWGKAEHGEARNLLVFFNFLGFGDGTGFDGPKGQLFNRQKPAP